MAEQTNGHNGTNPIEPSGQSGVMTWPLPLTASSRLDFFSDFASIAVVPTDDGSPRMFAQTLGGDLPKVDIRVDDDLTTVRVGSSGNRFMFWRQPVRLRLVICVPETLRGSLRTTLGRIEAGRLRGCNIELESGVGAIRAEDIAGKIVIRSKSGRLQGLGLRGSVDVSTAAGAIQLHLEKLDRGVHRVRSRVGAIDVYLDPGLKTKVDARAHTGRAVVEVPAYPDAESELQVQTHVGAIRVLEFAGRERAIPEEPTSETAAELDEIDRIAHLVVLGRISVREAEELLAAI